MTWQLASFLLLGLALLGGFAWYERSHPSSRVLALVGTLAALAVLGRVAFAAIPNVKPTTDIVLLAGYVFGGAPGFAVGAVAALVSNFFFTQGPWTPWQMVAWGLVGVFGALLGKAIPDPTRWGRLPLALACGLAGLFFGVIVNFGSVVSLGDADLWRRYVAYQSISLPWDIAHAAANVAFFYVFGPALIRTLRRFRTRMEFSWRPSAGVAGTVATLAVAATAATAIAAGPTTAPAQAADAQAPVQYLERTQNRDGGFGAAPGQSSVDLYTGWVALGLAAQGINPADVARPGGRSALDYVRAHARGLGRARTPDAVGDLERTILVVAAAGEDPRRFAGQDLVAGLTRRFAASNGSVLDQVNLTAFGILALRAADVPRTGSLVRRAAAWLARQQNRDGGYGFAAGTASDVDDTAAAIQALAAAGGHRRTIARSVAFLRRHQKPDGGLPLIPGGISNAQSTAWAIQAFAAAGVRPESVRRGGSRSVVAYLESLIGPGGVVQFSRSSRQTPVWVTAYGALALAQQPLPLRPVRRGARRTVAGAQPTAGAPRTDADDEGGVSALVVVPIAAAIGLAGAAAVKLTRR